MASQPGRGMSWVILEPSTWCFFKLCSLNFEICFVAFWGALRGLRWTLDFGLSSLMLASPTWFFGHWALNSDLCGCKEDSDCGNFFYLKRSSLLESLGETLRTLVLWNFKNIIFRASVLTICESLDSSYFSSTTPGWRSFQHALFVGVLPDWALASVLWWESGF